MFLNFYLSLMSLYNQSVTLAFAPCECDLTLVKGKVMEISMKSVIFITDILLVYIWYYYFTLAIV